jgi:hypothetical protein
MCVAALSVVAGIAQAVVGFAAAQADYNAKAQAWQQNYVNALAAGRNDMTQVQQRQLQEQDAFVQQDQLQRIEQAEKESEVLANSGATGISSENLVAGVRRQGLVNRTTLFTNYNMKVRQLQVQAEAIPTEEMNRINSMERPVAPNPLTYVVQALGSGVRAFG